MSTSHDCTTFTLRYCLRCSTELNSGMTPAGEPTLECPCCLHCVALSTVAESTLEAPRTLRQTLRRRMHAEALEVARELSSRQTVEDFSERRQVAFSAVMIVIDALQARDADQLRRLLEVA